MGDVELRIVDDNDFNPDMLTIARDIRGVTQRELAFSTGFNRGKISRWEGGYNPPNEAQIAILGEVLGFPPGHFTRKGRRYGMDYCAKHYQFEDDGYEDDVEVADVGSGAYQLPLF